MHHSETERADFSISFRYKYAHCICWSSSFVQLNVYSSFPFTFLSFSIGKLENIAPFTLLDISLRTNNFWIQRLKFHAAWTNNIGYDIMVFRTAPPLFSHVPLLYQICSNLNATPGANGTYSIWLPNEVVGMWLETFMSRCGRAQQNWSLDFMLLILRQSVLSYTFLVINLPLFQLMKLSLLIKDT